MKIRFNKKRIASFFVALGISVFSHTSLADVISYNNKATLTNGKEAVVYFITGTSDNDYAYVSFDDLVGYIPVVNVNLTNLVANNIYYEVGEKKIINSNEAHIYVNPDSNSPVITTLYQNESVYVTAASIDGWCVVSIDKFTGFVHENAFNVQKNEQKLIKINGKNVNVRTEPNTKSKDNIISQVNTGEIFSLISHNDNWYLINYNGQEAYIYDSYGVEYNETDDTIDYSTEIRVAKITGNNVNVRSSTNLKSNSNIIGFVDITDMFTIIDKEDNWFIIDYLGKRGYIYGDYVDEKIMNKEDITTKKMVYLTRDSAFYRDVNGTYLTILPQYQLVSVIKEDGIYYKVRVDSVIGYIEKKYTHGLTNTFVAADLGRQIVKIFKNNQEIHRAHMISGMKIEQSDIGVFAFGHKLPNYQLTPTKKVKYWMQYNGNEGFHDAYWQKASYFVTVAKDAYERFAVGRALTYPISHGSQGCGNLQEEDAEIMYSVIEVGDNVLIMAPNSLVGDHLISILDTIGCPYVSWIETLNQKINKLV